MQGVGTDDVATKFWEYVSVKRTVSNVLYNLATRHDRNGTNAFLSLLLFYAIVSYCYTAYHRGRRLQIFPNHLVAAPSFQQLFFAPSYSSFTRYPKLVVPLERTAEPLPCDYSDDLVQSQ